MCKIGAFSLKKPTKRQIFLHIWKIQVKSFTKWDDPPSISHLSDRLHSSRRLPPLRMFDEAEGRGKPMANAQLRLGCLVGCNLEGGGVLVDLY